MKWILNKLIKNKREDRIKYKDNKKGIYQVDNNLIAGIYYKNDDFKALVSEIGCVKLEKEPILIQSIYLNSRKIDKLLMKLKQNKIKDFISENEIYYYV